MGLFDIFSTFFKSKNSTSTQDNNLTTPTLQQTPPPQGDPNNNVSQTVIETPIEEPASVKSIDDLLEENNKKSKTNENMVEENILVQNNPAEPTPGIETTHTNNSLHTEEQNSANNQEGNRVKDISL